MAGKQKKEDKKISKDNGGRWSVMGMQFGSSKVQKQKKDDKVSGSGSRQHTQTTPIFQSEEEAPSYPVQLKIADSFKRDLPYAVLPDQSTPGTEATHYKTGSDYSRPYSPSNGGNPNFNNSRTHVLQAHVDPVDHHSAPVSLPSAGVTPSSPDVEYEHIFSDPSKTFKVNEIANTEVLPGSSEQPTGQQHPAFELPGQGAKPKVPELQADSQDTTATELDTSHTTQGRMDVRGGGLAEMSSSPRPRQATTTPRISHAGTQPNLGRRNGPEQRQPVTPSGPATKQVNPKAVQGARHAAQTMSRKAIPAAAPVGVREPSQTSATSPSRRRSESGNSLTPNIPPKTPAQPTDPGVSEAHLDLEPDPEDSTEEQDEEDQNLLQKEPTAEDREQAQDQTSLPENDKTGHRIRIPFKNRKRESDKKGGQLRKAAPQASTTQDRPVADDQKRLALFLKDHKVPKKKYMDQLSILLEWVSKKLADAGAEIAARDQELNRQATANKQQMDEIIRLKSELNTKERSEQRIFNDWVKADKQLRQGSGETTRLRADLEKAEKYAETVQTKLEETSQNLGTVIRERDEAQRRFQKYWEDVQKKDKEFVDWHRNEMSRVQGEHVNEMRTLQGQAQADQAQLNARILNMTNNHRDETAKMITLHQGEIASRDTAMALLENKCNNQITQLTDNHTTAVKQLEENHKKELEGITGQLQGKVDSLKRHMANYSNRGDYIAISDDDFRNNFQLLARRINNLISWVPRPDTLSFDDDLDPSGFFARNAQQGGRNWPKFVRNLCWRAIVRGFYGRQLGFGAFGGQGGEGFDFLDQLHQLFAIPDPQDPGGPCVVLPNTKPINTWRASFFEALLRGIRQGTAGQMDNKYVRYFYANVENVTDDIVSSLRRVSNNRLDPRANGEIAAFVEGLGTLALEMGSQRAHLYLETCDYGENLLSSERFKDDADTRAGNLVVDLMTQPCIRRIGDGREDLMAQRVIVKGDFVAMRAGF